MILNSIRWRLQIWHGLLLVLVLVAFGFTAYQVSWDNQVRRVDEELEQQLRMALRPQPGRGPERGPPPGEIDREGLRPHPEPFAFGAPGVGADGTTAQTNRTTTERSTPEERERRKERPGPRRNSFREQLRQNLEKAHSPEAGQTNSIYYVIWQEDGTVSAQSSAAPAGVPRPEPPAMAQGSRDLESGARPEPVPLMVSFRRTRGAFREAYEFLPFGESVALGRSMGPELAAMRRLALWMGMAGAGVLIIGLAGGWWVASRAIQPIKAISGTALKIAAGDLSQRINARDTESELGRLAEVLNSTFARLEAAFAHQARFTSDASHELRTPLAVIISQAQSALARQRTPEEYRDALEACERAARRMRKLSESLLALARLDAGQEQLRREPFDLAQVARESVELVQSLAAQRNVSTRTELTPAMCLGDPERLGQVVTNLLTNALEFNHPSGQVTVATRNENGAALLVVTDTGQGISPEDLPHIFERFYRADKSRTNAQGRNGLGLAISKAIVEAHSGTIEVVSHPGQGSTFTVRLPAEK